MKSANDLSVSSIDIADGLKMETKLRLGSILYLQEKYGESLENIDLTKISQSLDVIFCLIKQMHEDVEDSVIWKAIKRMDTEQITLVSSKISEVFNVNSKNSRSPVKGNLTEKK